MNSEDSDKDGKYTDSDDGNAHVSATTTTSTTSSLPNRNWLTDTCTTDIDTVDRHDPLVQEWIATIHYAVTQAGITLLDTAPWYGHGISEQVVGLALEEIFCSETWNDKNNSYTNNQQQQQHDATNTTATLQSTSPRITRQDIMVNTKVGRYEAHPTRQFDFSREATLASVQRSLQRLRTPYIDVLQLHDPEFASALGEVLLSETIPALLECRARGYCRALGLTGYPLSVQRQILDATAAHFRGVPMDVDVWDQCLTYGHYNLHDTTLLRQPGSLLQQPQQQQQSSTCESSFAEYCRAQNIVCLAAAPLSMGLLTPTACPPAWHPASPQLKEACRRAADMCRRATNVNLADLALLFALAEPRIPVTIVGMKDMAQVQTVQRLCQRLQNANFVLSQALTVEEQRVMEQLQDAVHGPFADVWKSKQQYYHWDGLVQVREFWKSVPGASIPTWQQEQARGDSAEEALSE